MTLDFNGALWGIPAGGFPDPALDPEGQELVARIHARKLESDLARQEANHARLVSEAAALGTRPEARSAWELVHEAAGIKARTISRLTQLRWTA